MVTKRLRILIPISSYSQTLENLEKKSPIRIGLTPVVIAESIFSGISKFGDFRNTYQDREAFSITVCDIRQRHKYRGS